MGQNGKKVYESSREIVPAETIKAASSNQIATNPIAAALTSILKHEPWYYAAAGAILLLASFLRLYLLELRPLHHDEGVNGYFLTNLFRNGFYHYDPANYHGPTLYYIALAFSEVFGLNTFSIRLSVAVWGIATVALIFWLRPEMGRIGTLSAALFAAASPGLIYISRYFIHETFFVFLALALVVSVVCYFREKAAGPFSIFWACLLLFTSLYGILWRVGDIANLSQYFARWGFLAILATASLLITALIIRQLLAWDNGRQLYLILAISCIALMLATKETSFLTLVAIFSGVLAVLIRNSIQEKASKGSFPWKIFILAAAFGVALGIVSKWKFSQDAVEFSQAISWLLQTNPKEDFAFIFYLLLALTPCLSVLLIYKFDKHLTLKIKHNEARAGKFGNEPYSNNVIEPSARASRTESTTHFPQANLGRAVIASIKNSIDAKALLVAAFIGAFILVFYFSSVFTYPQGILGFFEAYKFWAETGTKDHTQNGLFAYFVWGWQSDAPILLLSLFSVFASLFLSRRAFGVFAAIWSLSLFIVYTLIPYKTPWLSISFLLPMCLLSGESLGWILENRFSNYKNKLVKVPAIALLALSIAWLAYKAWDLNFIRYADEDAPMVYAHTQTEFLEMVGEIEKIAKESGKQKDLKVQIISPDYWPLVWYLRDYPYAIFTGNFTFDQTADVVIAKKGEQDEAVIRHYSANYVLKGVYPLRSGVRLILLARRSLVSDTKEKSSELYMLRNIP